MDCPVDDVLVLPPPTKHIRCKNNIVGTDNSMGIASEKINVANFPVANYASVSAASQTLMNDSSNNENATDDNGCGNDDDNRKLPLKCVIMTSILKGDDNDKEGGIEAFLSMYKNKENTNISGGGNNNYGLDDKVASQYVRENECTATGEGEHDYSTANGSSEDEYIENGGGEDEYEYDAVNGGGEEGSTIE